MIARIEQCFLYNLNLLKVTCLHIYTQETAINIHCGICTLVVYSNDVTAVVGDYSRNVEQLSGLVDKLYCEHIRASRGQKTAFDYSVENVYVNVTARNNADDILAFDGHFVEHCSCYGNSSRSLGDELFVLYHREDSRRYLIVGYCYNLVYIRASLWSDRA